MKAARLVVVAIAVWLLSAPALAHKPSDSYLTVTGGEDRLTATWDIALKDLELLVGLDRNGNGEITWGELKAQRPAVEAHALTRLDFTVDGRVGVVTVDELKVTRHSDGAYAVLLLSTDLAGTPGVLAIDYRLLFDLDPTHRGLVRYRHGDTTSTHVLSPDVSTLELRAGESGLWRTFGQYLREGVWHIWIGLDHVLFLLALLLPAVLIRREKKWEPVGSFRLAGKAVLKIVTVFTVAHSVTLWLAVMGYVTLPGRWVESVIALSIVVTALNNLFPVLPLSGWAVAFLFGLVHGFGFANVLLDLGLSDTALAVSLLAFNVGVELGQIAIVLVVLPSAFLIRWTRFYRRAVLGGGSFLIALLAAVWLAERAGNLELIGL